MSSEMSRRCRAERLRMAFGNHRAAYLASLLTVGLIAMSFRGVADPGLMTVFISWLLLSELTRVAIHVAFTLYGNKQLPDQLSRWEGLFLGGVIFSGLGWGFGAFMLYPAEGSSYQLALTAMVVGVTSLATLAAASHLRFAAGFILLALLPLLASHVLKPSDLSLLMGSFTVGIGGLLASTVLINSRSLQELLELRFSYSNMARELADEIFAKEETESRLDELAHYDPLTRLSNRSMFREALARHIRQMDRGGQRLAVVFLDLDRFKAINDSLGHEVGDNILRQVAERLKRWVRKDELLARQSSDEFLLALRMDGPTDRLSRRLDGIIQSLNEIIEVADNELRVSACVGVALFPDDGHSPEALIQHADIAMARAKEMGGNRHQFFQQEMHDQAMQRLALETALRKAIQNRALHLHYQPQVDASTGNIVGLEALARWHDKDHGDISPAEFIPLAEQTGLITSLGSLVLTEACRQARRWQGDDKAPFYIAVNLSVGQFVNEHLVEDIQAILESTGMRPENLVLEITESLVMSEPEYHIRVLQSLRSLGIRLALDDFGTGFSSLSYLRQLPIDILKLDRQFTSNLSRNSEDAAIARATITMAAEIGLTVVAEGVETAEQLEWLLAQDCHLVQGFFFSRPLAREQISELIALPPKQLLTHWPSYQLAPNP